MADSSDMQLLREYWQNGAEEPFAVLVRKHVDLVHSVALRHVTNPAHAEEITQTVFVILARKAGSLRRNTILEGWLYGTTRLVSLSFMRSEWRRQSREQEAHMQSTLQEPAGDSAWTELAPLLDEAMSRLGQKDRDAVVLRYFKERSVREIASVLQTSEAAAQRRVLRALEKLRSFFAKRGTVVSAVALTAAISTHSVKAAPVQLANSVTALAIAKGVAASGSTLTLIKGALKVMAWTKTKTAIVSAVVVASLVTPFVMRQQAQSIQRDQVDFLRKQAGQLAKLKEENNRLSYLAANSSLSRKQLDDLEKLRAALPPLQQQSTEAIGLKQENRRLQAALEKPRTPIQIKEEMMARANYSSDLIGACFEYAKNNQGQFPTSMDQAAALLPKQSGSQTKLTTDRFEIVYEGSPSSLANPTDVIVLREKESWQTIPNPDPKGKWIKYYGYADGSVRLHQEVGNNFADYEKQHIVSPNK